MGVLSEIYLDSYETDRIKGSISDASYSPNGEILSCSLDSGELVFVQALLNKTHLPVETPSDKPFLVEFSSSELLIHTAEKDLHLLDLVKQSYTGLFSCHASKVYSVSTSSVFGTTLSVAQDEAYIWDRREKNPHARVPVRGNAVAKYSPDGKIFMVLFEEKGEMSLFDARSYMAGPYKTNKISATGYSEMIFSPDSFGMVLLQEDGFSIADGFSGDITMHIPSEFPAAGCFTQDSRSFIYTSGPKEISISMIPETRSDPIFEDEKSRITGLYPNPCYDQIFVVSRTPTFLQNTQ